MVPSHYHLHVWLLVCSFPEMLFYFYSRCNRTNTLQKLRLLFLQSTEYFPKCPGFHQDVFWMKWDELLCCFWSAVVSSWNILSWSLSDGWVMNSDLNWDQRGLQIFTCCCRFYRLDQSLLCSWGYFCRPASPGKVHHWFLHLWIPALTVVLWSPKALEMTLDETDEGHVSHLFLHFFGSLHDVFFLGSSGHCQIGVFLRDLLIGQVWQ